MAINIFDFLGCKEPLPSDSEILAALKKEKIKWTNKSSQQPERAKAKLSQIAILNTELESNPHMLSEHRRMFGELQKEKKRAQEKALREEAQIFVVNGEIEEAHLETLVKQYNGFSKSEILQVLGVKLKAKKKPRSKASEKGQLIDRFIYKNIVDELQKLGYASLYEFLGLKQSAKLDDIKKQNDKIYMSQATGAITDANNTRKNLVGMVKTWLYDEDKRADYDKTLNNESFQAVADKIDKLAAAGKVIQPEQYKLLVEECTKKGLGFEQAENLICDYAEEKGITIVDGGLGSTTVTCRFCGSINDKSSAACKECGMPIVITCPRCKQISTSSEEMRCTSCGFNIGEMPQALTCLKEAETKLGFMNADGAMQSCLDAERYWPGYRGLDEMKSKILSAPPAAPQSLKVKSSGNTVNLQWTAVKGKYIRYDYIVVRKAGSTPNSPSDGTQVGVTTDDKLSDVINETGVSYYYAVYARNGKRVSAQGAKSESPVMIVDDLKGSDITLDVRETQIGFNFKKNKARSIDIYRDGQKIGSITGSSFIDNNLQTGRKYSYRFVAIYVDNNGHTHESAGVTQTIIPMEPPKPVTMRLESDSDKVATLAWTKPANGTVLLFRSDEPFEILPGNKVSLDGMSYEQVEVIGNSVNISKNWSGIRYFLPVTAQSGLGVAGNVVSVVSIHTVPGVELDYDNRRVRVKWNWDGCSKVRVSYKIDGSLEKHNDIEKSPGKQGSFSIIPPEGSKTITVSVKSVVEATGNTLMSEPEERTLNLKPTKVQFVSIKNVKKFFMASSKYEMTLTTDTPLASDLHLLASESVPPMDLVNYSPVAVIKPADVAVGSPCTVTVNYNRKNKSAPLYFRLIVANRELSKLIVINSELKELQ